MLCIVISLIIAILIYECNGEKFDSVVEYYNNFSVLKIKEFVDMNKFNKIKTINEHSNSVNALLVLKDKRIASCSEDKNIKVFDTIKIFIVISQ